MRTNELARNGAWWQERERETGADRQRKREIARKSDRYSSARREKGAKKRKRACKYCARVTDDQCTRIFHILCRLLARLWGLRSLARYTFKAKDARLYVWYILERELSFSLARAGDTYMYLCAWKKEQERQRGSRIISPGPRLASVYITCVYIALTRNVLLRMCR